MPNAYEFLWKQEFKNKSNYHIKEVDPLRPKIRIVGFFKDISQDLLPSYLKKQNPDLIQQSSFWKLIRYWPIRSNNNLFQADVEVDVVTYNLLLKSSHILIGLNPCSVYDSRHSARSCWGAKEIDAGVAPTTLTVVVRTLAVLRTPNTAGTGRWQKDVACALPVGGHQYRLFLDSESSDTSLGSHNYSQHSASDTLRLYYQNIRSVNNKFADIHLNSMTMTQYDILILTETWLKNDVSNNELFEPNIFNVYRKDRDLAATDTSRGGGLNSGFDEIRHIGILIARIRLVYKSVFVIVLYIPPSAVVDDYARDINIFQFYSFSKMGGPSNNAINACINFAEFFNLTQWNGDINIFQFYSFSKMGGPSNNAINACINFAEFFNLTQWNGILNRDNRLLDLVFSNFHCFVSKPVELLSTEDSYQPALCVDLSSLKTSKSGNPCGICGGSRNFRKANLSSLYESMLNTDFSFLDACVDVNKVVHNLYKKLEPLFSSFVPIKRKPSRAYPPWYNGQIISNLKMKEKAWQKYKRNKTTESYNALKSIRATVKLLIRTSYKEYLQNITSDIKRDPKKFWTFIKNKSNHACIPANMFYKGNELSNPQHIADAFAHFFARSFHPVSSTSSNTSVDSDLVSALNQNIFDVRKINESEVLTAIKKLKPTLTAGPDEIPSFFVKDCGIILASPLTVIFNLILSNSKFPDKWKLSRILPIHKKGSTAEISEYRPIALINNFAKVFEFVMHARIFSHVSQHLSPMQHGFIKGRSTVTNLMIKTQYISEMFDKHLQVDCIYLDFSKAFDRIDHRILLHKLESFGFSDGLLSVFKSYLSNRYQYVFCTSCSSRQFPQTSGVPQGSVLGPLLFIMYINDIVEVLDVPSLLYADDIKIFFRVQSSLDCIRLQDNLNRVLLWSKKNNLLLNADKCIVKSYSIKLSNVIYNYVLDQRVLQRPDYVCDLGVTYDAELSFHKHYEVISTSAHKSLGFVVRNAAEFKDLDVLRLLFLSYVRSVLEYASVAVIIVITITSLRHVLTTLTIDYITEACPRNSKD
ncbi:uncharacterized protein LOC135145176 [Zophobas morio]|uniref:uncharacterized protein LOC135145176 n=1 Tax=Zophobas morio TaxID=2755281 RepID=UPI003082F87C